MSLKKPSIPPLDQMMLFMLMVSFGIGYPLFESKYGGKSVNLSDILVVLYSPVILTQLLLDKFRFIPFKTWLGPGALLIAFLIAILIHASEDGWISIGGWCRPTFVFFTAIFLLKKNYMAQRQVVLEAFIVLVSITIFVGIIGLLCYFIFGISTAFVMVRPYYLGLIPVQLSGLDGHPNGAAQLLFLGFWVISSVPDLFNRRYRVLKVLAWMGIFFTQSKSILIYIACAFYPLKQKTKWATVVGIVLISSYVFLSHCFPLRGAASTDLDHELYVIPDAPLFNWGSYTFYQTTYTANKIAAWSAFISSPLAGVGPHNYIPFVQRLQQEGHYPMVSKFLNPHCTYTSILARFGGIGVVGLICYILFLIQSIQFIKDPQIKKLFSGVFMMYALDAITSDLEYQRIFWFFNAWLVTHLLHQSSFSGDLVKYTAQHRGNKQDQGQQV